MLKFMSNAEKIRDRTKSSAPNLRSLRLYWICLNYANGRDNICLGQN